jgi:hypothetical protein
MPWIVARTGPDGTFTATGQPGDYYAQATAPGYLSLQGMAQEELAAGQPADQVLARLPIVHITADGIAQVSISIVRGATLSGQVVWEDGSPASGVPVTLQAVTPVKLPDTLNSLPPMDGQRSNTTDDRGHFRLTGIAAGEYYVQTFLNVRYPAAQFSTVMTNASLLLYAPGVLRRAGAKSVKLTHGEERDDLRMVLDLGKLHTITGHVSGLATSSTSTTAGTIFLRDTQEQTLNRTATVLADGTFKLLYLPAGTYGVVVSVRNSDAQEGGHRAPFHSTSLQQTVTVGDTDITGLELTMPSAQ